MSELDGVLMLGITEAKTAADQCEDLDQKIDAAMKATNNHWMILDEDKQFRAAVGGLILSVNEETQTRIKEEMASLRVVGAMMSGIPVDIERVEVPENPLGLLKRWKELKKNET